MAAPVEQRELLEKIKQGVSPLDSDDGSDLDNDPVVRDARDSTEVANYDREVLDEEEERETLLASERKDKLSKGILGTGRSDRILGEKVRNNSTSRRQKKRRRETTDGEGKLTFEMEEGGPASDVSSQVSGSSLELDRLNGQRRPTTRVSSQDIPWTMTCLPAVASKEHPMCHYLLIDIGPSRRSYVWRIQSVESCQRRSYRNLTFEWVLNLCPNHYCDISRRFPRRLLTAGHYPDLESINCGRCFTKMDAPQLSERDLPKSLYPSHGPVSRKPRNCRKYILGPRSRRRI